jgi:hypothetical protein
MLTATRVAVILAFSLLRGNRVRANATTTLWKVLAVGNGQEMAAKRPNSLTQFGFHVPTRGFLRVGRALEN